MSFHRRVPLAIASSALALAFTGGCGSDGGGSTTGKRITLQTAISGEAAALSPFTTGFGWDVELSRAKVATSAFYYFDGPPPTASLSIPRRSLRERFASYFVGTAWAHPGHYQSGTALGEVIFSEPVVFDLFSPSPRRLPAGEGVTGIYRSARFVFPSTAPADAALAGHLAIAEGRAVKHGDAAATPIYFRLIADSDDIAMNVNEGAVDGCVLDETKVGADGTISAEIRPTVWLNLVDFSKIDPGSADHPTEAHSSGFSQGLTQLSAYHFSYSQ
ncbi:MAG TPA: hypothetical protein VFK05_25165 [Polyangiaceae bacterium]|nr:hypothetical protein [Polyangiaceae bacterium]